MLQALYAGGREADKQQIKDLQKFIAKDYGVGSLAHKKKANGQEATSHGHLSAEQELTELHAYLKRITTLDELSAEACLGVAEGRLRYLVALSTSHQKKLKEAKQWLYESNEALSEYRNKLMDSKETMLLSMLKRNQDKAKAKYLSLREKNAKVVDALLKEITTLRITLAAIYAHGTGEIACDYYRALMFTDNIIKMSFTQLVYALFSYINFSRLTCFKLSMSFQDLVKLVPTLASAQTMDTLAELLHYMSIAGAAIYSARLLFDIGIVAERVWKREAGQTKMLALYLALIKGNRGHRMFNNFFWLSIMLVSLAGSAAIKASMTCIIAAGYLVDLLQDLWKASYQISILGQRESVAQNIIDDEKASGDEKNAANTELKQITKEREGLMVNSRLYFYAFYGVLLGAMAFCGPVMIVAAIVMIGAAFLAMTATYSDHLSTKDLFSYFGASMLAVALGIFLIANPFSAATMGIIGIVTAIVGLLFTASAQAVFTYNRYHTLKSTVAVNTASFLTMGVIAFVFFNPVSIGATIGLIAGALLVTLIAQRYATKYATKSDTTKTFIEGMLPLKKNSLFPPTKQTEDTLAYFIGDCASDSEDEETSVHSNSPTLTEKITQEFLFSDRDRSNSP